MAIKSVDIGGVAGEKPTAGLASPHAAQHYVVVDGLRGIAALLVLFYHTTLYVKYWKDSPYSVWITNHAYLAVDCFFLISGFVIAYAFDKRMQKGMGFIAFMKHRVIRLYPMILIGLCLGLTTLAALYLQSPQTPKWRFLVAFISAVFLIPTKMLSTIRPYLFPVNSAYWSLSFEMVFYGAYALTYRIFKGWLLLVLFLGSGILLGMTSVQHDGLNLGFMAGSYWGGYGRVLFSFVAGMVLKRYAHHFSLPKSASWLPYLSIIILIGVMMNPIPAGGLYDALVVLVAFPGAIFLATFRGKWTVFERCLSVLGEISYPLYAIHFPLVLIFSHTMSILHASPRLEGVATLTFIIVTVSLAYLLNRFYDVPVRRYLSRILFMQKKVF